MSSCSSEASHIMLQMSPAQLHLRYHLLIWFSRLWLSHGTGFRAAVLRQAKHTLRRELQELILYRLVAKQPGLENSFSSEMLRSTGPSSAGLCMSGWASSQTGRFHLHQSGSKRKKKQEDYLIHSEASVSIHFFSLLLYWCCSVYFHCSLLRSCKQ